MKGLIAGLALLAVLGAAFMLYSSPTAPAEMTDADRQAVAAEVKQASEGWLAAWARNDIAAAMATLVDDPGAYFVGEPGVFVNNLTFVSTVEEVRANWGPVEETRTATRLFPSEQPIAVLSPDHAAQVIIAEWNVTDTEGVTTPNARQNTTLVWVREGGAWRILHWHQSWTRTPVEGGTEG